jgi:hypothetical protein
MKKHFTIRERELREKIIKESCSLEDLRAAEELALETHKVEHLSIYSQVKRLVTEE